MASTRRKKFIRCLSDKLEGRKYRNPDEVRRALGKANKDCSDKQ